MQRVSDFERRWNWGNSSRLVQVAIFLLNACVLGSSLQIIEIVVLNHHHAQCVQTL
jgi:hypothetical protein